jgi:hypothetical protein
MRTKAIPLLQALAHRGRCSKNLLPSVALVSLLAIAQSACRCPQSKGPSPLAQTAEHPIEPGLLECIRLIDSEQIRGDQ